MEAEKVKWYFILFAVIVVCSIALAIFLIWFTKSLWGLLGLLLIFTYEICIDTVKEKKKEEKRLKEQIKVT